MVNVEKRGTLAIEEIVSLCPHLDAYISTNDKTPLIDGFILMYRGLGRSKTDITGRVDVQIKAQTVRQKLAPASFRMQRSELETLRQFGTVILFYVAVRPDGSRIGRPKYAILSPYNVGGFLSEMKKNAASFAVPLRDLPEDHAEIESIVAIAHRSKNQTVDVGSGYELLKRSTSISISSARDLNFDEPVVISYKTGDFLIEVETPEGSLLPLPREITVFPPSYAERPLEATLRSGDVVVTDATVRQTDPTHHEIRISEGLTLTFTVIDDRPRTGSVTISLVDNLAQRVRDIDFFLDLASGEPLHVNDVELPHTFTAPRTHDDLRALRERTTKLLRLLDHFHADPALIDMSQITDDQHRQLWTIYRAVFEGIEAKTRDGATGPTMVYTEVGPWRLILLLMPGPPSGAGIPFDPFDPENRDRFGLYSTDESGQRVNAEATIYDTLKPAEFPPALNLNLSSVVDAYRRISTAPNLAWLANRTTLSLIHAADAVEARRPEFLGAALALNDWLEDQRGPSNHGILNRYQIIERQEGGLSAEHKREIRNLRRRILASRAAESAMHEAGCAILLKEEDELEDCLSRLSEQERQDLEGYPIWGLTGRAGSGPKPAAS